MAKKFQPHPYNRLVWRDSGDCWLARGGHNVTYRVLSLHRADGSIYAFLMRPSEQEFGRAYATKEDAMAAAEAYDNWVVRYPPVSIAQMQGRVLRRAKRATARRAK